MDRRRGGHLLLVAQLCGHAGGVEPEGVELLVLRDREDGAERARPHEAHRRAQDELPVRDVPQHAQVARERAERRESHRQPHPKHGALRVALNGIGNCGASRSHALQQAAALPRSTKACTGKARSGAEA